MAQAVRDAIALLKHRGPDGNRVALHAPSTNAPHPSTCSIFGHCRLAIIDPAHGQQPLYHHVGDTNTTATDDAKANGLRLVHNGMMYNDRQLRQQQPSTSCATQSDSECIFVAYRKHFIAAHTPSSSANPDKDEEEEKKNNASLDAAVQPHVKMARELDGMFSFVLEHPAVVDAATSPSVTSRVVAARDPLGIKPLYYATTADKHCVLFMSELKALGALLQAANKGHGQGAAVLNELATRLQEFPPGHVWMREYKSSAQGVSAPHDALSCYYAVPYAVPPHLPDAAESAAKHSAVRLRAALEEAVRKRLRSDVPLGAFLSGGVDSSVICAMAARQLGSTPLHTFVVGLQGSSDLPASRLVAKHIGSVHHELTLSVDDLRKALPHVLLSLESFDCELVRSSLPCYFVAQLAAQHDIKVVLTGEGADELFAGYTYYSRYWDQPSKLHDELRRSLHAMHNINLQRVDRVTMAHGLEARVPFLDVDVIDAAMAVPPLLKMGPPPSSSSPPHAVSAASKDNQDTAPAASPIAASPPAKGSSHAAQRVEKWILRYACADLLPSEVLWRRKVQFDQGSGVDVLLLELSASSAAAAVAASQGDSDATVHGGPAVEDKLCGTKARSVEELWYKQVLADKLGPLLTPHVLRHVARWEDNRV